jgi:hypothetical protein
VLLRR